LHAGDLGRVKRFDIIENSLHTREQDLLDAPNDLLVDLTLGGQASGFITVFW